MSREKSPPLPSGERGSGSLHPAPSQSWRGFGVGRLWRATYSGGGCGAQTGTLAFPKTEVRATPLLQTQNRKFRSKGQRQERRLPLLPGLTYLVPGNPQEAVESIIQVIVQSRDRPRRVDA
jgi:hypothetical protein